MWRKLMYKFYGHKWKYGFTSSINGQPRMDFRVCLRTHQMQYLFCDDMKVINDGKKFWMNAICYTDIGAVYHYPFALLR